MRKRDDVVLDVMKPVLGYAVLMMILLLGGLNLV